MNKNITYIDVDKLVPHPKNPRLEVGDVSELADSIKKNGVLQNLTVVPFGGVGDGRYTVIIGHRRLVAAKLAGVKELPCVIADMDEKEQIETMLIENMQRRQLTPYEEAEGFQLMFDFGGDIHTVAERTGFSETTVRNRMKLLRLDKEAFKKSQGKNISLNDYLAVAELEDEDARKEVLEKAGTNNFTWYLNRAKDEEERKVNSAAFIRQLEKYAERIDVEADDYDEEYWDEHYCRSIWNFAHPVEIDPDEYSDGADYYFDDSHDTVKIYRVAEDEKSENEPSPEAIEAIRKEKERRERYQKLKEVNERAFELRKEFVKTFTPKTETDLQVIAEFELFSANRGAYDIFSKLGDIFGVEIKHSDDDNKQFIEIVHDSKIKTFRALLISAWYKIDSVYISAYDYNGKYRNNDNLAYIYNYLSLLGYQMSDEEKAYLDGTHELFLKGDN